MARKTDERVNKNVRASAWEWDVFKKLLGPDWLRKNIHEAAKKAGIEPPAPTDKNKELHRENIED
jgi:hypothetical protein